MAEKDTDYKPIIQPDPEDEKPEEGFVPYCGSEEAAEVDRKPFRKFVLLMILLAAMILVFGISLAAKHFNYYHSVLSGLQFDYREGEGVINPELDEKVSLAETVAQEIGDRDLHIQAAMYLFDENQNLQNVMSEYDYTHSAEEDLLSVRTGSVNSLFRKSFTYRKTMFGNERKKGSGWTIDSEAYVPKLNEYFFGTEDHGSICYQFRGASEVEVGGRNYTCELWTMEDASGQQTVYTTLYRYYSGTRLKGVRILFDFDELMEVYDVQNYVIG